MNGHPQTWIKVNTEVDCALAEAVAALNSIEGLQTLQSCQGERGERPAYIYFSFGEWQSLCRFVFDGMAPRLKGLFGEDIQLEVIACEGRPFAKMSFSAEALTQVTSALKEVVSS
jgi:hypothetical protein